MIDAVLTHPHSPLTCGVAKFSHQLAELLGVPCGPLEMPCGYPLVSIKGAEYKTVEGLPAHPFDLFAHDAEGIIPYLSMHARKVYAANSQIALAIRDRTHRMPILAFCPSTVQGNPHRGAYKVLAFGMAHKLALDQFKALKAQLDREHPDYTVSLSTAVHEGNPWDEALNVSTQAMRCIFGDKLRVLGYLGDDALAKELQDCDAVAVYFDPAVRENNTSVWAALSAGKTVYTNTDAHSPELNPERYSWGRLLEVLGA